MSGANPASGHVARPDLAGTLTCERPRSALASSGTFVCLEFRGDPEAPDSASVGVVRRARDGRFGPVGAPYFTSPLPGSGPASLEARIARLPEVVRRATGRRPGR